MYRLKIMLGLQIINMLGALEKPKGITNLSYNLLFVLKVVFHNVEKFERD